MKRTYYSRGSNLIDSSISEIRLYALFDFTLPYYLFIICIQIYRPYWTGSNQNLSIRAQRDRLPLYSN